MPRVHAGNKLLPVCPNFAPGELSGAERDIDNHPSGACAALRWLMFGWLGERALSSPTLAAAAAQAMADFRAGAGAAGSDERAGRRGCAEWSLPDAKGNTGQSLMADAAAAVGKHYCHAAHRGRSG